MDKKLTPKAIVHILSRILENIFPHWKIIIIISKKIHNFPHLFSCEILRTTRGGSVTRDRDRSPVYFSDPQNEFLALLWVAVNILFYAVFWGAFSTVADNAVQLVE